MSESQRVLLRQRAGQFSLARPPSGPPGRREGRILEFVVGPAEEGSAPHAEGVPLGEQYPTGGAAETVEVKHFFPGPHHQL